MDADGARLELADVVGGRLRVHADQDRRVEPVPDVPPGAGPDVEPGRQPLDVRREDVLAAARDAHAVQGAEQDEVGRLAAGAVDRADPDGQVVHRGLERGGATPARTQAGGAIAVGVVDMMDVASRRRGHDERSPRDLDQTSPAKATKARDPRGRGLVTRQEG